MRQTNNALRNDTATVYNNDVIVFFISLMTYVLKPVITRGRHCIKWKLCIDINGIFNMSFLINMAMIIYNLVACNRPSSRRDNIRLEKLK